MDTVDTSVELSELAALLRVVRFDVSKRGVATVVLDRPGRGNSWTSRMNAEYRALLHALDADPAVRVVVVTGAGRSFCVGADSRALVGEADEAGERNGAAARRHPADGLPVPPDPRPEWAADLAWQCALRIPVVAAVNGACAGVALALVAYSDIRFAMTGAKVTAATSRLGLPVEYGLSWILPRLVARGHATDLLLSGRVVSTDFLGDIGFFNAVYPPEEFETRVREYAELLAAASPQAVAAAKSQLGDDLLGGDPASSVRRGKELTERMMRAADYREGVAALVERRDPVFGDRRDGTERE
ncbi:enoyl-CoA hydratase-related protein [Pseudonocardia sp. NPDC049154]|uniref:enoyl-CoA hydratase-related protein n=1 Tax=Pseudonocardia sp. NPDC049154 TaxID=3155501 RepID=UPI0034024D0D